MWSDEGLSLHRAQLSVSEITANTITIDGIDTRDTNPPFYFLLLHLFYTTMGDSIFARRYLGVLAATLAIPLIYSLGTVALGRRVGLVAALLIAISPFHVWQAQVMRNYGLLLTLNLISVYGLFRFALASPGEKSGKWIILWGIAGLLGIYTHYFGFCVFAYGIIALGLLLARRWDFRHVLQRKKSWLLAGLVGLILLPIVALALSQFSAGPQIDFYRLPLKQVLNHAASAFSVGVNRSLTLPWWRVLPVVLIALAGIWFSWRNRALSTVLLLGYQIIPLGLLLTLSIVNPIYNGVRHLLIGLPPFLLFTAAGIVGPFKM